MCSLLCVVFCLFDFRVSFCGFCLGSLVFMLVNLSFCVWIVVCSSVFFCLFFVCSLVFGRRRRTLQPCCSSVFCVLCGVRSAIALVVARR